MEEIRIGVIGCGGMARNHMKYFDQIDGLRFVAASDVVKDNLDGVVDTYAVRGYEDGHAMLTSGELDAVLIATPHYFHPEYAIAAFETGVHVMTEKPVAVRSRDAVAMNEAADRHPELIYGVMHQTRTDPARREIRRAIQAGEIGQVQRYQWTSTYWFRNQAYFDSGDWRATWEGEGGGVLMNQCPHDLDQLHWFFGTPQRLRAFTSFGKHHRIEVEDEVHAFIEYENGAVGTFIAGTGEHPGVRLVDIVGDRGRITVDEQGMRITRVDRSSRDLIRESTQPFRNEATVARHTVEISSSVGQGHAHVMRRFVEAIRSGDPSRLVCDGREGLGSVQLINAMIMSGYRDATVSFPFDHEGYAAVLEELIAHASGKKS